MKKRLITEIAAYVLIILFVYASANKLLSFDFYLYDLHRSPLLMHFAWPLAILIPGAELLIAAMLLTIKYRQVGFKAAFILMILFTIYVAIVVLSVENKPCSCGGIIRNLTWRQHLVFNIFFTLIAYTGTRLSANSQHITTRNRYVAA